MTTIPPVRMVCALVVRGAFDARIVPACEAGGRAVTIDRASTSVIRERMVGGAL